MCHRMLMHTECIRGDFFRVLKTREGNVFVGYYNSTREKENEKIRQIFKLLCQENDKAKESMTIDEVINMVKKKYNVFIKIAYEFPRPKTKQFEKPRPRKMYLEIIPKGHIRP